MFDNIHFQLTSLYVNETNFDNQYSKEAVDSEYEMNGAIRILYPHPISRKIQDNYLYMHFFALMDCDASYFTKRKNFNSYLLLYTLEGSGTLEYHDQQYTLSPGDGFLIDCREYHYYKTLGDHWVHCDLHFNGHNSNDYYQAILDSGTVCFHSSTDGKMLSILEKLLTVTDTTIPHQALYSAGLLSDILLHVLRCTTSQEQTIPDTISHLARYMENNYTKNFSLDELAKFSGLSKYHLCREFRKYLHFSPKEYLIEYRIARACFLLETTDIPAYKIGIMIGINDENNFINLFKKRTGLSPGLYRKQNSGAS